MFETLISCYLSLLVMCPLNPRVVYKTITLSNNNKMLNNLCMQDIKYKFALPLNTGVYC